MSKEYIPREAAIERLEKLFQLQAATARTIIDAIPAADVVEVVRCSECNSNERSDAFPGKCWCRHGGGLMPLDGFCSYGVRKNETR